MAGAVAGRAPAAGRVPSADGEEGAGSPSGARDRVGVLAALGALSMAAGRGGAARAVARTTGLVPGGRLICVGCGPGTAVRLAARRGATAVGVEPSAAMRWAAGRLTPRLTPRRLGAPGVAGDGVALPSITWLEGNAERLPLVDASATLVWSLSSLHHWEGRAAGVAEVLRVLVPGGRALFLERRVAPGRREDRAHGLSREAAAVVAREMEAAGWARVGVEELRVRGRVHLAVRGVRGVRGRGARRRRTDPRGEKGRLMKLGAQRGLMRLLPRRGHPAAECARTS